MSGISIERLRDVLAYDLEAGSFRWRCRSSNRVNVGDVAGTRNADGYTVITIDGTAHYAHRLAWFHETGTWPIGIDHRNGDTSDNRIANLRPATQSQNMQNVRRCKSSSRSGVLGVSYSEERGRWVASITVNRRQRALGRFDTADEAAAAYRSAKELLHPYRARATQPVITNTSEHAS